MNGWVTNPPSNTTSSTSSTPLDLMTGWQIESSWHKPNMSSHVLSAASIHTCEQLPEGELRLLVANFVLRKPLDDDF